MDTLNYFIEDNFEYLNHFDADNLPNIVWKRPSEVVDDPCLLESYDNEIDGYLICGLQTPSWFPVLSTLVKSKDLLNMIVKDIKEQDNFNKSNYTGSFEFSFFGQNTWSTIIIDDRLPFLVDDNKSLFCVSSNKEEFLPSLLEKAYVRYRGGYSKFQKGNLIEALMHFTGGIVEKIEIGHDFVPLACQEQKIFFKRIKSLLPENLALCYSYDQQSKSDSDTSDSLSQHVLPSSHYYMLTGLTLIPTQSNLNIIESVLTSLIDFKNDESIGMFRLRNPTLKGDWNGPYSVGSVEWDALSESVRRHFDLNFNHEFEFWMAMDDFNRSISNIIICHIPSQSYLKKLFKNVDRWLYIFHLGKYSAEIPGGSIVSLKNEFLANDQYIIEVLSSDAVEIKCVLSVDYIDTGIVFQKGCGLVLLKVENNRRFKLHDLSNSEMVSLKILSQTANTFTASLSLIKGRYIILPWRIDSAEMVYCLRIYSLNKSINVSLLKEDRPRFIRCLKCSLVKSFSILKDMITDSSMSHEVIEKYPSKINCSFCLSSNPFIAIRITILSATGVETNEDKSNKNTYFVFRFADYSYTSNTKYLTNNPIWNESFIVYRTVKQTNDIWIEVFSEEKFGFDKSLGMHVFSDPELNQREILVTLKVPVNKEWVYSNTKVLVKLKNYLPELFNTI